MKRPWRDPGVLAAIVLLSVYSATAARGLTLWDAGEFHAAIHSLGIPHPPGTPVYIVAAHVWSLFTSPFLGFAFAVNVFSAVCTAAAFGIFGHLLFRWTGDAVGAFAAAVCSGAMSTVWLNATEAEVYAPALLVGCLIVWSAYKARETHDTRWLVLAAYWCGIGWALHLTALLTVPAAAYLVLSARPRRIPYIAMGMAALLGATFVCFMLIRAQHDPVINQGNPATWNALWDVITRSQYDVAPLWPRQAPLWLQIGNVFQYADWQFALALYKEPGPAWGRTTVTILFVLAGVIGFWTHRRVHRESWRVMGILLLTGTLFVVLYLNLKAGPSFGYGILDDSAAREARERDYFFTLGFAIWGLWAGYGIVSLASRYGKAGRVVAIAIACTPIALNWSAIMEERRGGSEAIEADARALLENVPDRAVYLAFGDNDTYPLWYLQEVEQFRRDVIVVTVPLLGPVWYREEVARRTSLLTTSSKRWLGLGATLSDLCTQAALQGRDIVLSPFGKDSPFKISYDTNCP